MNESAFFFKIRRYRNVAAWFGKDAYWRFRWLVASITVLAVLSLASQFLALGIIFKYVQGLENGAEYTFLNITYSLRDSALMLLAAVGGAVAFFSAGAFFRYWAGIKALLLARRYEEHCIKRAAALLGKAHNRRAASNWLDQAGKLIQADPRFCGRVARILIMAAIPALTFLGTLIVLLYLDPVVTMLVGVVLLLSLPFLYWTNIQGAQYSMALERSAPDASKTRRNMVGWNAVRSEPLDPDSEEMQSPFVKGALRRNLNAYVGRLQAVEKGTLVTQLMTGAGLIVIMGFMGADILKTGQGWGTLATYLVALRVNLTNLAMTGKKLTSVNRFYPQVSRYYRFLQEMHALPDEQGAEDQIEAEREPEWRSAVPTANARMALEVPSATPDWLVQKTAADIFRIDKNSNVFFIGRQDEEATLRERYNLPENYDHAALSDDLIKLELGNKLSKISQVPNFFFGFSANTDDSNDYALALLEIVAAARSERKVLVIYHESWLLLDKSDHDSVARAFEGKNLVLLNYGTGRSWGDCDEAYAIKTDGEGILLMADALAFEKLRKLSGKMNGRGGGFDDDDMDDE